MKELLLLALLLFNTPVHKKLVMLSPDGHLISISRPELKEYNPDIDYSKIYYEDNHNKTLYGLTGVYAQEDFTLSKSSLKDLEYIKGKQVLADYLHLWSSVSSFIPYMISTPDHEAVFSITGEDWDEVALLIAVDVPMFIRGVMIKELNFILYKAIKDHRPQADISFWRSFLNTYVKAKTIASRRTYKGSTTHPELGFTIKVKISLKQKRDGNYSGQLHLNIGGRANTFTIKNIEMDAENRIIKFEHAQYGRTNYFEGDISDNGKAIYSFGSYFNDNLLWEVKELNLR